MPTFTPDQLKEIEAREALYTRALECLDEKKELDKILDNLVANNKLVEDRIEAILRGKKNSKIDHGRRA
ncbi:hypothetical protein K443DRAFT_13027 [Laccaria amethystina LaAM-08-1]|uniref:Uncharacterized protein n=1 Tax=Laccaria amethystina LaAM-08-1 TaxID=1095629 RepID=A0A0C9XAA3_9AGAR|nr:hypothetical protein K443DRAFT_13027 [Laccaria amethystina LaAM-08-1]